MKIKSNSQYSIPILIVAVMLTSSNKQHTITHKQWNIAQISIVTGW